MRSRASLAKSWRPRRAPAASTLPPHHVRARRARPRPSRSPWCRRRARDPFLVAGAHHRPFGTPFGSRESRAAGCWRRRLRDEAIQHRRASGARSRTSASRKRNATCGPRRAHRGERRHDRSGKAQPHEKWGERAFRRAPNGSCCAHFSRMRGGRSPTDTSSAPSGEAPRAMHSNTFASTYGAFAERSNAIPCGPA